MTEIDKKAYERMQSYIKDVEEILELCRTNAGKEIIQEKYKILKNDIKGESKFWDKESNSENTTKLVNAFYIPSIQEASAFGFEAYVNGKVEDIHMSLLEAEYKLTKYKSKAEWFSFK